MKGMMDTFYTLLPWVLGAVFLLKFIKEIISPPEEGKKWPWLISLIIAFLMCVVFIIKTTGDSKGLTKEDVREVVREERDEEREWLLQQLTKSGVFEKYSEQEKEDQRNAAESFSKHAESALDSGLVDLGLQKFETALVHFGYALTAERNTVPLDSFKLAEIHFDRGIAYGNLNNYEEELESYDSALTYRRDHPVVWYNRGIVLFMLGHKGKSVASYDSALTYRRDYPDAWLNRGFAQDKLGHYEEAISSYDSALFYRHDYPDVWLHKGIALTNFEHYEQAVASYDSALFYRRDYPAAWHSRGYALGFLGLYEEAIASCDSALKYDPTMLSAIKLKEELHRLNQN